MFNLVFDFLKQKAKGREYNPRMVPQVTPFKGIRNIEILFPTWPCQIKFMLLHLSLRFDFYSIINITVIIACLIH